MKNKCYIAVLVATRALAGGPAALAQETDALQQPPSQVLLLDNAQPEADLPAANPEPTMDEPANATAPNMLQRAEELVFHALSLLGVKYQRGGASMERGFDCSGFVRHVFREAANLPLPHNAYAMSLLGQPIKRDQLQPGDLVFFNTLKRTFSHVGIYIGDNRFIHAPRSGRDISIAEIHAPYWLKRFNGARRLLAD